MKLSPHATKQASRRSIALEDIEYVLDYGHFGHQMNGRTFFFCGTKVTHRGARNLAVIMASDGTIVTVVRTRDLKRLRSGGSFGSAFHVG